MSEVLLRSSVQDLRCFQLAMRRRAESIRSTENLADRFHCRIMLKILDNTLPTLEAIQKMNPQQRTPAHALFYVSKLAERIHNYAQKYSPSYESRVSAWMRPLVLRDFERVFSALDNIVYALEKGDAPTAHTPPATSTPPSALGEFNPLSLLTLWYYILSARAAFLIAANAPQAKASPAESPEAPVAAVAPRAKSTGTDGPTLVCVAGGRIPGAPRTGSREGVLHLVRP